MLLLGDFEASYQVWGGNTHFPFPLSVLWKGEGEKELEFFYQNRREEFRFIEKYRTIQLGLNRYKPT